MQSGADPGWRRRARRHATEADGPRGAGPRPARPAHRHGPGADGARGAARRRRAVPTHREHRWPATSHGRADDASVPTATDGSTGGRAAPVLRRVRASSAAARPPGPAPCVAPEVPGAPESEDAVPGSRGEAGPDSGSGLPLARRPSGSDGRRVPPADRPDPRDGGYGRRSAGPGVAAASTRAPEPSSRRSRAARRRRATAPVRQPAPVKQRARERPSRATRPVPAVRCPPAASRQRNVPRQERPRRARPGRSATPMPVPTDAGDRDERRRLPAHRPEPRRLGDPCGVRESRAQRRPSRRMRAQSRPQAARRAAGGATPSAQRASSSSAPRRTVRGPVRHRPPLRGDPADAAAPWHPLVVSVRRWNRSRPTRPPTPPTRPRPAAGAAATRRRCPRKRRRPSRRPVGRPARPVRRKRSDRGVRGASACVRTASGLWCLALNGRARGGTRARWGLSLVRGADGGS